MSQTTDALQMALKLTVAGQTFKVPGASIKSLEASLHPWGFSARLGFWVSLERGEDQLFEPFTGQELIEVALNIEPHFKPEDGEVESLDLQGLATGKAILEERTIENAHLSGDPVLYRHYQIDFKDPAAVIWEQHFPCDLRVDDSVKGLIEANKPAGVELQYDWKALEETCAVNTLACAQGPEDGSFRDFLLWYAATRDGVFSYDSKHNRYLLSAEKPQQGIVAEIGKEEVHELRVEFPAPVRFNDRLLNVHSENPGEKQTRRPQAAPGVRRDLMMREAVTADFEQARPGKKVKLGGGLWSDKLFTNNRPYRVRDMQFSARAENPEPDADHNMPHSVYALELFSTLETWEEKSRALPSFSRPAYPLRVEGRIVSEQGRDEDETYQAYQHPQQGTDQYRVEIPVFANRQVVLPFEPLFAPGSFYFPASKGQRVLIELDFHQARIAAFLDWRPGARLPMDSQGDHLLLGKSAESNTSISHIYVDNKPQLNMKRTSASDTEVIRLHEGSIILETKEEPS